MVRWFSDLHQVETVTDSPGLGGCHVMTVEICLWVWLGWSGIRVAGWSVQHGYHSNPTTPKLQYTLTQEQYDQCGNSTESRRLLMMDILMSETCWAHKKWNKLASDIKLVFYTSTIISTYPCNNIDIYCRFYMQPQIHAACKRYCNVA